MANTFRKTCNPSSGPAGSPERLLVFNCHEAWVYQLGYLPMKLDIIVGLPGRYKAQWDEQMRPVPANARLVTLEQVLGERREYHCIIAHNISDLMDVKQLTGPRVLVIHSTLEGRVREENSDVPPAKFAERVRQYLSLVGGHAVPCSLLKGRSWQITKDIVPFAVDADDYAPWSGETKAGLRICNHITSRRKILEWDFHEKAFGDIPVRLVGHNDDMPGVKAADNWGDLKQILSKHRFYIHTADCEMEDGYNMAVLEAMAAGLPVLGNCHPSSPVEDGVSGFLSDDPAELRHRAQQLLEDQELAGRMGAEARKMVSRRFAMQTFCRDFMNSISIARRKWSRVAVQRT